MPVVSSPIALKCTLLAGDPLLKIAMPAFTNILYESLRGHNLSGLKFAADEEGKISYQIDLSLSHEYALRADEEEKTIRARLMKSGVGVLHQHVLEAIGKIKAEIIRLAKHPGEVEGKIIFNLSSEDPCVTLALEEAGLTADIVKFIELERTSKMATKFRSRAIRSFVKGALATSFASLLALNLVGCGTEEAYQIYNANVPRVFPAMKVYPTVPARHMDARLEKYVRDYNNILNELDVEAKHKVRRFEVSSDIPDDFIGLCQIVPYFDVETMKKKEYFTVRIHSRIINNPILLRWVMYHELTHCYFRDARHSDFSGDLMYEQSSEDPRDLPFYKENIEQAVRKAILRE
jgi:hypothetical protein